MRWRSGLMTGDRASEHVKGRFTGRCALQEFSAGRQRKNVVPRPTSLWKVRLPLCRSTTARAIARPCPVPRPTSLVVKNGSKMRSRMLSGIPAPLSAIVMSS